MGSGLGVLVSLFSVMTTQRGRENRFEEGSQWCSFADVFIIHRLFTLIPLVLIVDLGSFELFSCEFDVFGVLVVFCRF